MMEVNFKELRPKVADSAFICPGVSLMGDVTVGDKVSIWYNCVIRGDVDKIAIGAFSNIQDLTMLHVSKGFPLKIGDYVTVGHSCTLHGCTIGDNCLIGMGAVICDGAKIGAFSIVGAGTLVPQNKEFPEKSMIFGNPAKIVRTLRDEEVEQITKSAHKYLKYSEEYRKLPGTFFYKN